MHYEERILIAHHGSSFEPDTFYRLADLILSNALKSEFNDPHISDKKTGLSEMSFTKLCR